MISELREIASAIDQAARRFRVLMVEDKYDDRERFEPVLREHGWTVEFAGSLGEARRAILGGDIMFDLIVVDGNLPEEDGQKEIDNSGVTLVTELRSGGVSTPILMLTGLSDEVIEANALAGQADEWVTKFGPARRLLTRIDNLMRRRDLMLNVGPFMIDFAEDTLRYRHRPVPLNLRELAAFAYLAAKAPTAVSKAELLDCVWGYHRRVGGQVNPETNPVEVAITRLRSELNTLDIAAKRLIRSVPPTPRGGDLSRAWTLDLSAFDE